MPNPFLIAQKILQHASLPRSLCHIVADYAVTECDLLHLILDLYPGKQSHPHFYYDESGYDSLCGDFNTNHYLGKLAFTVELAYNGHYAERSLVLDDFEDIKTLFGEIIYVDIDNRGLFNVRYENINNIVAAYEPVVAECKEHFLSRKRD